MKTQKNIEKNTDKINARFALHLKELLLKEEISAAELSRRMDVSRVTTHGWVKAVQIPSPRNYQYLCDIFELDYDHFFKPPTK